MSVLYWTQQRTNDRNAGSTTVIALAEGVLELFAIDDEHHFQPTVALAVTSNLNTAVQDLTYERKIKVKFSSK